MFILKTDNVKNVYFKMSSQSYKKQNSNKYIITRDSFQRRRYYKCVNIRGTPCMLSHEIFNPPLQTHYQFL